MDDRYSLSSSPPNHSNLAYIADDDDDQPHPSPTRPRPFSPPATTHSHPERPSMPTRASTVGSPNDLHPDHNSRDRYDRPHARSEDLNHTTSVSDLSSSAPARSSALSSSRPTTPAAGSSYSSTSLNPAVNVTRPSASSSTSAFASLSAHARRPSSVASDSSDPSSSSHDASIADAGAASTAHTTSTSIASTCSACGKTMQGAFVRALGSVYHLNCFICQDCGAVVASKFFPIDGSDGKQHPLCERDYFRRLNLICAKCGQALRGSYITACNKKYHVDHFTCSVCPTLFGPQDSYYEHAGDVYCHFHYSTRFATKCAGCGSAILKQFVEINRNMRDECWHPECYMINKFWNVKVSARRPTSILPSTESLHTPVSTSGEEKIDQATQDEPPWAEEERKETAGSLKEKQAKMEQQVYRIWTVLSAFEESSAACISDMLRQVSNGQYLEAIRMAEKFILHVEVLFATIDELEFQFARLNLKGMSHVREARMLCRKTVDLFTLLSHTQETGARRMGMTQELLALVTGLAHYLKILIRIALTGALKLEREQAARVPDALGGFLDKLHMLAIQGGSPGAKRMLKRANGEQVGVPVAQAVAVTVAPGGGGADEGGGVPGPMVNAGTQGVTYGFRSLAPENSGESPFAAGPRDPALAKVAVVNPPSDLCVKCGLTVEEDCVRLGTYQRWHSHCLQCMTCGKAAAVQAPKEDKDKERERERKGSEEEGKGEGSSKDVVVGANGQASSSKLSSARRPPANVRIFVYDPASMQESTQFGSVPAVILCTDHARPGCRSGFQTVSRLEQYAFLLNVALRRLYVLLKKRGVVPATPSASVPREVAGRDPYGDDINRLKSVHLDRKLSATARVPKWSTVVESPTGRVAQASDATHPSSRHGQGHQQQPRAPKSQPQHAHPPRPQIMPPGTLETIRPSFARQNTEVMIVDQSTPTSPAGDERKLLGDGIALADIAQIVEAAQAREQHRSLPRQGSVPFIAELNPVELAIVKHSAVLALIRSPLRDTFDLDEILELVEMKKNSFWNKIFKQGNDKKGVKKKGVFGVPLELLVEREGSDSLHGASLAPLRVPSFIDDVVSAMRQMDMSIEGIFRKNGNIRRLKELTDAIDRDPSSVDLSQDNPVQLAALLKKFLRELPDPLLTYKLHRLFIATQNLPAEGDRKRMLHMVSLILPKYHRDTMEVLFVFLKWVASFAHMDEETGSKMDLQNLATVICPSILYSRGKDGIRDESFGAIRVVTSLLENQDEFFCVPEEFLPVLHDQEYFASSMDLPSKEFLKKCDTYTRLKASGRTPGLTSPVLGSSPFNATTPRSDDSRSLPPRAPQSNPQYLDRPALGSPSPSEYQSRSGLQSRTQSPPSLQHSSYSYPPPNGPPASLSQGMATIQAPQPRTANGYPPNGNGDWTPPQISQPPSRPPSRPSSYIQSRSSGDGAHPFPQNSHAAQAVRQRI